MLKLHSEKKEKKRKNKQKLLGVESTMLKNWGGKNKQKHPAGTNKVVMLNKWQEKKQPTGVDEVGMFDNWEKWKRPTGVDEVGVLELDTAAGKGCLQSHTEIMSCKTTGCHPEAHRPSWD